MNARLAPVAPRLVPMTGAQLDAVLEIERAAYAFPWTRGNFVDSLAAGYPAWLLCEAGGSDALLAYLVAMHGVAEVHLLNLTVAPAWQQRGLAVWMLDALVGHARERDARRVWLEVRAGNARAQAVYTRFGFERIGLRKGYYPAPEGRREDAVMMGLAIDALD